MAKLFTYTIRVDDGAAPNPFGKYCTLTICKPKIRKKAQVGDWVAGFGSVNAPSGDLSGKLVYAMKITEVLSMQEYDIRAKKEWPSKIPDQNSTDIIRHLGDCIYDFSTTPVKQRAGVHNLKDQERDLSGENALLSNHFFYFGKNAIELLPELAPILHQTQGHKCPANDRYVDDFVCWLENYRIDGQKLKPCHCYGRPAYLEHSSCSNSCTLNDKKATCQPPLCSKP